MALLFIGFSMTRVINTAGQACYNGVAQRRKQAVMSRTDIVCDRGIRTRQGPVSLIAWATPEQLRSLRMDAGLGLFWNHHPEKQHRALVEIAATLQGRVVAAVTDSETIVGFLTFHAPSRLSRWGRANLTGLVELGGIEVASSWRRLGLAKAMLGVAFADAYYDDKIVIAAGLSWCWDLSGTGLSLNEYRQMLVRLVRPFGFAPYYTDDPEIVRYPGNGLVARIGPRAPTTLRDAFMALRVAQIPFPFSQEMARVAS